MKTFVDGCNAADGKALAHAFAADADFTAITGLKARGRDIIAKSHDEILSTVYRGSVNSAKVESIRFPRPDVAVAGVTFRFVGEQPAGRSPSFETWFLSPDRRTARSSVN